MIRNTLFDSLICHAYFAQLPKCYWGLINKKYLSKKIRQKSCNDKFVLHQMRGQFLVKISLGLKSQKSPEVSLQR